MATFTGTIADETITPATVTPSVVVTPAGATPSNDDDIINAGGGADTIDSGGGNDTVKGEQGNDTAQLGAGIDTFIWNPGDGSDTVDGGADADTLDFFGSNGNEIVELQRNGSHLRFTRDIGNIVMDMNNTETVIFHALGGTDTITVGDLTGTDVTTVALDLGGTAGSGVGDALVDRVTVNGTGGSDVITVTQALSFVNINGLAAGVSIDALEVGDFLTIDTGAGNDFINAQQLNTVGTVTIDVGDGDDTVIGSRLADVIQGGNGNDTVSGDRGNDTAFLGAGNDTFIWRPGDGSDSVDGGTGVDALDFFGSNAAENIDITATRSFVTFFRDVANVTMDLEGVETVVFHAFGGADNIEVADLSETDVTSVRIDLEGVQGTGAGDGAADTIILEGSRAGDVISVTQAGDNLTVNGLPTAVAINTFELANDRLTFRTGAGNDVVTGSKGNDTAELGTGSDRFIWNPGDGSDTIDGGGQTDTLEFRGSNANEVMEVHEHNGAAIFHRDVANITMVMVSVETMLLTGLDGANQFTVGNLTGTDMVGALTYVGGSGVDTVNAAAAINDMIVIGAGGADILTGGSGDDTFRYVAATDAVAGEVVVGGIGIEDTLQLVSTGTIDFTSMTISGIEVLQFASGSSSASFVADQIGGAGIERVAGGAGLDLLTVNGPFVDLSTVLFSNWTDAYDFAVLNGTAGSDTLIGTDQSDILIGGLGADDMHGGAGNDRFRYTAGAEAEAGETINGGAGSADTIELRNTGAITFAQTSISGVEALRFAGGLSIATIAAAQLGAGAITHVIGSAAVDRLVVGGAHVDLSTVLFSGLSAADRVTVNGTAGNDSLIGSSVADSIVAGSGNDSLNGGSGKDSLNGGLGNDVLRGGIGADRLAGGVGHDVFVFTSTAQSGATAATRDTILDFRSHETIKLTEIDANVYSAGNQAFKLDNNGSFSAGEIRQTVVGGNLLLQFNTDGDAAAEMSILLAHRTALLHNGDFLF